MAKNFFKNFSPFIILCFSILHSNRKNNPKIFCKNVCINKKLCILTAENKKKTKNLNPLKIKIIKATIISYSVNAILYYGDNSSVIHWDGMEWNNEDEWNEWADDELESCRDAENYEEVKSILRISTDHLINN